jgi:phospholipase A1/A2
VKYQSGFDYRLTTLHLGKSERSPTSSVRIGYQHESNGKDGDDSRSLNIAYVRPSFVLGHLNSWILVAIPEFHAYVGGLENNPRLKDYRGYGKLRFVIGKNDGPSLMFSGWSGEDFENRSYQLDLSIPLRFRFTNIESFVLVQYFDGYGESLRAYDRKSDAFRLGLGLIR